MPETLYSLAAKGFGKLKEHKTAIPQNKEVEQLTKDIENLEAEKKVELEKEQLIAKKKILEKEIGEIKAKGV